MRMMMIDPVTAARSRNPIATLRCRRNRRRRRYSSACSAVATATMTNNQADQRSEDQWPDDQ
jgi:hypothetical protein